MRLFEFLQVQFVNYMMHGLKILAEKSESEQGAEEVLQSGELAAGMYVTVCTTFHVPKFHTVKLTSWI